MEKQFIKKINDKIKYSSIILMEVLLLKTCKFIHTLNESQKSFIHNEDECLHSANSLFLGLPIQHSFCGLFFGFSLHVYKGISPSQIQTLGSRLKF